MPYLQRNVDKPFGLMPSSPNARTRPYNKDASASRIFPGDVVMLESDGNVAVITAGTETNILGVAAEGSLTLTAKTDFLVYDDPDQEFVVQDDSAGAFVAQTNVGNNADIVVTTGNTDTDRSNHELDISSAVTTAAPLRILGLHGIESGFPTASGSPRRLKVKFGVSNHLLATGAGI